VLVLDCQTDQVVAKTLVGNEPNGICLDQVTGLVHVSSKYAVHMLSPTGDSVVGSVQLPDDDRTYMCAVPFPSKVYAAREHWMYVIDGYSHTITDSISVSVGVLVCDTDRGKVYAAARPVQVFDGRGDSVLLTIPVTNGLVEAIAWNRVNGRVYMTCMQTSAVYVIRDTSTAIAERADGASPTDRLTPTLCRGKLRLDADGPARLLDLSGRQVARLKSGDNGVRHLRTGVYFVRPDKAAPARKVIIQN
jgi:DNA-binding beta-propeller fold protein YncE